MKFLPFLYEQSRNSNNKKVNKKKIPKKDVSTLPNIINHSYLCNILLNQNLNNKRDPELYRAESTDAEQNVRGKKEELKNEISKVYVKNTDHEIYLLKFKTKDIRIEPVYLKDRVFEENSNDKCVQLPSITEYKNMYNIHSSKMNCLRKKYKLNKASDHLSKMSSKKPIMKKAVYELPPAKKERTISSSFSNIKKSVIYLYHNDILFSVYPGVLEVKSTRLISNENDKSFIEITDLNNRAHIVVRHKKDVLKFCFTLTDISYEKVKEKITTGMQTQDDNIYIRGFSEITNREVYYPIPISNYNYKDPLIDIHQKNMDLKLNKLEARWMSETRKKRIREYRKCRYPDPYKNLVALHNGSYLNFDVGDRENKTKSDIGSLQVNDSDYEKWVINKQKEVYQSAVNQRKNEFEAENNFNDMETNANLKNASEKYIEISDWDLIYFRI